MGAPSNGRVGAFSHKRRRYVRRPYQVNASSLLHVCSNIRKIFNSKIVLFETGIVWGAETGINTFVGHEFEVIEVSVVQGVERCLKKRCRRTRFVVNQNEDQGTSLEDTVPLFQFIFWLRFHLRCFVTSNGSLHPKRRL